MKNSPYYWLCGNSRNRGFFIYSQIALKAASIKALRAIQIRELSLSYQEKESKGRAKRPRTSRQTPIFSPQDVPRGPECSGPLSTVGETQKPLTRAMRGKKGGHLAAFFVADGPSPPTPRRGARFRAARFAQLARNKNPR